MTEDRSNAITLGALGMFSGAAAWALINLTLALGQRLRWTLFREMIEFSPLSLFPGLAFGLVIGVLLRHRGKVGWLGQFGYVAAAAFAYFCAYHVALHVYMPFFRGSNDKDVAGFVVSGIPAGLVGSFLLGLLTIRLLEVSAGLVLFWPVMVGTVGGALLGLIAQDSTKWGWSYLVLFALWQGAYAASLAPLLRRVPSVAG